MSAEEKIEQSEIAKTKGTNYFKVSINIAGDFKVL